MEGHKVNINNEKSEKKKETNELINRQNHETFLLKYVFCSL